MGGLNTHAWMHGKLWLCSIVSCPRRAEKEAVQTKNDGSPVHPAVREGLMSGHVAIPLLLLLLLMHSLANEGVQQASVRTLLELDHVPRMFGETQY